MCRKQWAAPRASEVKVFVNADETSSSASSVSVTGTAGDTAVIDTYTVQSLSGCCLPVLLPELKC